MKLAQIIHREKNITYGVTENSHSMTRLLPYARQLSSVYSTFFCRHEEERIANITGHMLSQVIHMTAAVCTASMMHGNNKIHH